MKFPKLDLPLRTTLLYLLFGGLWILISDQILFIYVFHDLQQAVFQTLKGLFFVLVSAIVLYILLLMDYAGRKRAEQALSESEELYRHLLEAAPVGIAVHSEGRIVFTNPAGARLLGAVSEGQIVGKPILDFIHPDEADKAIARNQRLLAGEQGLYPAENLYRKLDGSPINVEVMATAVNYKGKASVQVIASDITARKQTEEALREKEERLRLSLEAASQGLYDLNVQTGEAIVNREYAQMLGYDPETFIETNNAWIERLHPDDRENVSKAYSDYIHGLLPEYRVEFRQRTKDGSWKWILSLGKVIKHDEEGKPLRMLGTHTDITERKRAEEEIASRSRQLTALLEASQSLTESLNLAEVLQKITDKAAEVLSIDKTSIYLAEGEHLYLGASTPSLPPGFPETLRRATLGDHPHITEALVTGQSIILPDAASAALTAAERTVTDTLGLRTIFYIPLAARKDAIGVLILGTVGATREFTRNEEDVARALSNQAALAIANAKLYEDLSLYVRELENQIAERKWAEEKLKRHINYLNGLREIDQAIASSFDVRLSLSILTSRAVPLLSVDAAAILLLDPITNTLEYVAGQGFSTNIFHTGSIRLGESYAGRVVMERRMLQFPIVEKEPEHLFRKSFFKEENIVSYHGIPLMVKGKVVGVMEVFHRTLVERDQEWFDFLNSLAGQAAIAIDNARLWDQVQRHARDMELRVADRTAALNRTNAELEHANRAKDEFLANMSHELRTPLNSILGLSESLLEQRRDLLTDHQQKSLQIIASSGQHLLELINDVLDLSKIEAGKFDYYPQMVEVEALCRSSLSFIKSQAARKSISLNYSRAASVSKMIADPRRLKQILVNLLTNAVKFTPEGGEVTLHVHADREQDILHFSVIDNGIGIAPQDLQRLFQPFVQVDSKLNRQFEGTGLGLALVQKLTDLHGGSVEVESELGVGSRFIVNLPWKQEEQPAQAMTASVGESKKAEAIQGSTHPSKVPLESGVILLAEDNMTNIVTLGEYLESHGYRVVKAYDGLEAIEKAEAHDPDVILMDIQMPTMDGMEATRRLRANPRFSATPIIALTALAMPGDWERCLAAGANEYLSKPVRLKSLIKTVRALMEQGTSTIGP